MTYSTTFRWDGWNRRRLAEDDKLRSEEEEEPHRSFGCRKKVGVEVAAVIFRDSFAEFALLLPLHATAASIAAGTASFFLRG